CSRSSVSILLDNGGNSSKEVKPKKVRKSILVPYIIGLPTLSFLPTSSISDLATSVCTGRSLCTPLILSISYLVIVCLIEVSYSVDSTAGELIVISKYT